jgi:hypothetical protein
VSACHAAGVREYVADKEALLDGMVELLLTEYQSVIDEDFAELLRWLRRSLPTRGDVP